VGCVLKTAGRQLADQAEFFYSLDRNLEDVDTFYNKKYSDTGRRLKLLQDQYGKSLEAPNTLDRDEVEDLIGALLELRTGLRKLQWYAEVNKKGFVKITKKLDKKLPAVASQRRYLATKVDITPFATKAGLQDMVQSTNNWLSVLGEVKVLDDRSSTHSSHSMARVSANASLNLSPGFLDSLDLAIRSDDAPSLIELLQGPIPAQENNAEPLDQRLLLNLLQRAISCRSKRCMAKVLDSITTLADPDDINDRNCLHRFVISIGRMKTIGDTEKAEDEIDSINYITPAASSLLAVPSRHSKETNEANGLGKDDNVGVLLQFILDDMKPSQRSALQARDINGRLPLHYAAQYGLVMVCQIIISRMQAWGQFEVSAGTDALFWQDSEGWTPLHLSVIGGHPLTTRTLLEAEDWRGVHERKAAVRKHKSKSGEVLALATRSNFVAIVQLLVDAGVDVNYRDGQGETALHVAARFGHLKCAEALLHDSNPKRADTEAAENVFGWTPLFIACVDGHLPIVKLLIEAGADLARADSSGWTAKEHAALRGHVKIAYLLSDALSKHHPDEQKSASPKSLSSSPLNSLADRKSAPSSNGNQAARNSEPIKTFGHRYLTDETMVLVSLGTMDMRKKIEVVNLDRVPLAVAHSTQLDTALSVVVSATGAFGEPTIVDLPVHDNISTDPIVFTTTDATKVKLLFDIVPTYAGAKDRIIGRGVALLSSIKPSIGSKRITLQGDVTVPVLGAHTLDVIGSVNFNFLIITPFTHPSMSITENQTYWKKMASTMVIGHRGRGDFLPFGSIS
jgi:glycerophosphodiester phosphodiesterase